MTQGRQTLEFPAGTAKPDGANGAGNGAGWGLRDFASSLLGGRASSSRRLARTISTLGGEVHRLVAAGKTDQAKFLALSGYIQNLAAESETVLNKSDELLSLALGEQGGEEALMATTELLAEPLSFEAESQTVYAGLLRQMSASGEQIERTCKVESELRHTLTLLRTLQTLFRVESAHLSEEAQLTFQAVTSEIQALEARVTGTFEEKFRALRKTRGMIRDVAARIGTTLSERGRSTAETRHSLDRALAEVREQFAGDRRHDTNLSKVTQSISREVAKLVMSIQTHDIVTQKIEHLATSLTELETECRKTAETGGAPVKLWVRLGILARVQGQQLSIVGGELVRAKDTIVESTARILEQAADLEDSSVLMKGFSDATTSATDMIQLLLTAIAETRGLAAEAVSSAEFSAEAVKPLSSAAKDLTDAMTELGYRVSLLALNAQVEAAHHGEGTGLGVLAAKTVDVASETVTASEQVREAMDEVGGRLMEVESAFVQSKDRWQELAGNFNTAVARHESTLHAMRDRMLQTLAGLSGALETVHKLAGSVGEGVRFLDPYCAQLDQVREALSTAASTAAPFAAAASEADRQDTWMSQKYTMEGEREIHRAIVNGTAPPRAKAPEAGSDVELF